jgi:hypothetical protein
MYQRGLSKQVIRGISGSLFFIPFTNINGNTLNGKNMHSKSLFSYSSK